MRPVVRAVLNVSLFFISVAFSLTYIYTEIRWGGLMIFKFSGRNFGMFFVPIFHMKTKNEI